MAFHGVPVTHFYSDALLQSSRRVERRRLKFAINSAYLVVIRRILIRSTKVQPFEDLSTGKGKGFIKSLPSVN